MTWPTVKLGDIVQLITKGTTPTTLGNKFTDAGVGFVRAQNIIAGSISFKRDSLFISEDTHHLLKRSQINAGDVLVAIAGTIGRVGIVPDTFDKLNCNQAVAIIRVDKNINNRFLLHWLSSTHAVSQIKSSTVVGVISNLSLSQIANLKIHLPPLAEQQRIAAILDKAEEIKRKREQAIAKLDELAQSTFVEMFGDPVNNNKKWALIKLGAAVTKLGSGSTPTGGDASYKDEGISLVRSLNVHDGEFVFKNLAFINEEQATKLANVQVKKGDILLNITGASVARVCRVPDEVLPARVNQHVMIVRPSEVLNPIFLERLLLSSQMKRKLLRIGGAGATREAITKAQAEKLEIISPPIKLQIEFARHVERILAIKDNGLQAIDKHLELRSSLQHQAFTTGFRT